MGKENPVVASCETCKYFGTKEFTFSEPSDDYKTEVCRRRPPIFSLYGGWPEVEKTDWCGEYESREHEACEDDW